MRLTVELVQFASFGRYADLLREQLGAVGIRVQPRLVDPAAMVDAVFRQRAFDLTLVSYCNGTDPEIGVNRMDLSSNIGNIPFSNAAAYRNPKVDELIAAAGGTTNRERRAEAYRGMQQIVVKDLPYIWLVETDFTAALAQRADRLRGLERPVRRTRGAALEPVAAMGRYLLQRLLQLPIGLAVVGSLAFLLIHLAPGGPVTALSGEYATAELRQEIEQRYGLDRPLAERYPPGQAPS